MLKFCGMRYLVICFVGCLLSVICCFDCLRGFFGVLCLVDDLPIGLLNVVMIVVV